MALKDVLEISRDRIRIMMYEGREKEMRDRAERMKDHHSAHDAGEYVAY